jgi:hypothetical protein
MLNNLKAISLGLIVILLLGLTFQLIIILSSVAYNWLAGIYPVIKPWSQYFNYAIGLSCYFVVMASAGFITASASKKQAYTNTSIAALLGMSLSLYLSLQQEIFTLLAFFFLIIGLAFSLFGCYKGLK